MNPGRYVDRHFFRCNLCLSTFFVDGAKVDRTADCACGGTAIMLGRVTDTGNTALWIGERHVVPCDARCTNANGYRCDCPCRGENHGTGRVVTIEYIGGRATVRPPDPDAFRRADELRDALARWEAAMSERFRTAWDDYRAGKYIDDKGTWMTIRWECERKARALAFQTHRRRMQELERAIACLRTERGGGLTDGALCASLMAES